MAILSCSKLNKSFGINTILDEISFNIEEKSRVGIVGPNGAGKSTLFKILVGEISPDSGNIYIQNDIKIGYLPQNYKFQSLNTIWDELLDVYTPLFHIETRLRAIEQEMGNFKSTDDPNYISLADEYAHLLEKFDKDGGYGYESHIKGVLAGLGFTESQYEQPISQLSGGQKTRVALARLLLENPDLLLLDEPTNYLDLNAIEWLEQYLISYPGTLMIISHDRYFLDSICNMIIEIENGKNYVYNGNYTNYIRRRIERLTNQQKAYDNQQREIARQKAIIERYRAFNREKSVRAAESRQKRLDKMELVDKPHMDEEVYISFDISKQSGYEVLKVENLSKSFDDFPIFKDVSFSLNRGERVAIIGPNGVGKSTLIKIIMGLIEPSSGNIEFGTNISIGYYDQEQSSLIDKNTVIDEVWRHFPNLTQTQIRNALASFLFTGDDVFKTIDTLSGGERGKVLLTKLALARNNFLILDEPTNHLDLDCKEQLEMALNDYPGTILVVSHDRYFLNKIVDKILVLHRDGITEYMGNYNYYIEKKKELLKQKERETLHHTKTKTQIQREKKNIRNIKRENIQRKNKIQSLESSIQGLENALKELELKLADPKLYEDSEEVKDIQIKYAQNKEHLDKLYEDWISIMNEI